MLLIILSIILNIRQGKKKVIKFLVPIVVMYFKKKIKFLVIGTYTFFYTSIIMIAICSVILVYSFSEQQKTDKSKYKLDNIRS